MANKSTSQKREVTRAALISATHELVLLRGYEKISIQDITEAAQVGLGTFYNYFQTKQLAFEAVLEDIQGRFNDSLNVIRQPLKDPATIVAVTMQYSLAQAQDNRDWTTFVEFTGLTDQRVLHQDAEQLLLDIQRGATGGRFKVNDPTLTHSLILGMIKHVSLEIRRGNLSRSAIPETTRHVLRMLGLPDQVAKALTQTPMSPVAVPRRSEAGATLAITA